MKNACLFFLYVVKCKSKGHGDIKKIQTPMKKSIMQKVTLTFKTPRAVIENGNPVIKYETQTETHIVASTKSQNNLIDDMQRDGKIPTEKKIENLFLDRAETEKAVDAFVSSQIKDTKTAELVSAFVKNALDGACVYYKPIIRKK